MSEAGKPSIFDEDIGRRLVPALKVHSRVLGPDGGSLFDAGVADMDFDGLEAKGGAPRTKTIYLCNPHNPVGRVWSGEELRRLGDICARRNVLAVSDEIHGDITFDGHKFTPFATLGAEYADRHSAWKGAGFVRLNMACPRAKLEAGSDRLAKAMATM